MFNTPPREGGALIKGYGLYPRPLISEKGFYRIAEIKQRSESIMNTFFKRMFSHDKQPVKNNSNMIHMMLPSFIGIAVCAMSLVGLTFAWFTASAQTEPQKIVASNWKADVSVMDNDVAVDLNANGDYLLDTNKPYTVSVTPIGTGSGYCVLEINDKKYYTEQIKGSTYELELMIEGDEGSVPVTLTTYWGNYSGKSDVSEGKLTVNVDYVLPHAPVITDEHLPIEPDTNKAPAVESEPVDVVDDVTESAPETATPTETTPVETIPGTYTVRSGDTLVSIATKLGTTVEALAAYNEIDDANKITVGQVLNIPPVDYVVPADATTSDEDEDENIEPETTEQQSETASNETKEPAHEVIKPVTTPSVTEEVEPESKEPEVVTEEIAESEPEIDDSETEDPEISEQTEETTDTTETNEETEVVEVEPNEIPNN